MYLSSFLFSSHPGKPQTSGLKIGDPAPLFTLQTHEEKLFDLSTRKGKWTVLYFYPKASTPGCTKQACGFRDAIIEIRFLNAEVYGISSDNLNLLCQFHHKQRLSFALLSDPSCSVIKQYKAKMGFLPIAKRYTFIIDPDLKIQWMDKKVDPILHAEKIIETLKSLQAGEKV